MRPSLPNFKSNFARNFATVVCDTSRAVQQEIPVPMFVDDREENKELLDGRGDAAILAVNTYYPGIGSWKSEFVVY
ncbi:hypothetical protein TcasGA2_TC015875 [Tribolium castaneum]|uniref:Uncharacterized protein n=1 Tax=Tribolium castaneum TaxID=7070 RepID=D7GY66_TRICA|nr:hypothetical protein TcasGA2_TC015875 [Tribolium castaneum]